MSKTENESFRDYAKERKLIIEVDGSTHDDPDAKRRDTIRQLALEDASFTILRFRDEEIFLHLDDVRLRIQEAVRKIQRRK